MIPDLIMSQIRSGEGIGTEFTRNPYDIESIGKTVCAFLNTQGGTIFCGVGEDGTLLGVEGPEEAVQLLRTHLQELITPKALFTVNSDTDDGVAIISVEVPEGKDRPYVMGGSVFVRHGASTVPADVDTLRRMVQSKAVEVERWERRPSMAMDEEDLDHEEVQETARVAQESGRFRFLMGHDDIGILRALAVYTASGFTQAADVLFSQNPALRHPQTRVRLVRFESDKGGSKYFDDRFFHGPLMKVFEELFGALTQHVKTESHFHSGVVRRLDRPEYPFDALREGLVNAFAHRDYAAFSGGIVVSIYPNRIEIWNSGRLPEGLKLGDLKRNHPSLPTNPDIAHVLYLRGLMERIGRGTQKIISACREYDLPPPKWVESPSGVTLTLFSAKTATEGRFIPNERQRAFLESVSSGEIVKPSGYHERFAEGLSERQSRRDLAVLEAEGFLIRLGAGAGTYYQRSKREWLNENRT